MAEAHYFIDFRPAVAEFDEEADQPPWRQAMPQVKILVIAFILSVVIACAYPLSYEDIFSRL